MTNKCIICDPKCKYDNCICPSEWKTFESEMNLITSHSSKHILDNLRISTITLCCNYNINIDMDELMDNYPCKNNGKFYNSAIFNWKTKYQTKIIVSVKVFPNGKVQIAGVNTIMSCAYIIRKVMKKLEKFNLDHKEKKPNITNLSIAMINSDFKIKNALNLVDFCKVLTENTINNGGNIATIIYQPVKYPAINLKLVTDANLQEYCKHLYTHSSKKKFSGTISVLIFRSGSIIITGGNDISEYSEVYSYILNLIENNLTKIII